MKLAALLFALAAVMGLTLATAHFRRKALSLKVALVHGALGASGLVALLLAVTSGTAAGNARLALGLFVVAALGGFFLFSHHLRKKPLPSPAVVVHALVAVVAFVILLLGLLAA